MTLDNIVEVRMGRYANPYTQFYNQGVVDSDPDAIQFSGTETSATTYKLLQDGWAGADAPQPQATYTPASAGQGSTLTSYKLAGRQITIPVSHTIDDTTIWDRGPLDNVLFGAPRLGAVMLLSFRRAPGQQTKYLLGAAYQGGFDRPHRVAVGAAKYKATFASEWPYLVDTQIQLDFSTSVTFTIPNMPGPVLWGFFHVGSPVGAQISLQEPNVIPTTWTFNANIDTGVSVGTNGILGIPGHPYTQITGFAGTSNFLPINPIFGVGRGRTQGLLPHYLEPNRTYTFTKSAFTQIFYVRNHAGI